MLTGAYRECPLGIDIVYQLGGYQLKAWRLQARSNVSQTSTHSLQFPDDGTVIKKLNARSLGQTKNTPDFPRTITVISNADSISNCLRRDRIIASRIDPDLAIETIELLPQSKYDEMENRLGHAKFLQLLKFCLRTYFAFDGTIYEEVKGTAMGSPISASIAEAVLQQLESLVF
nr:unnamed protein product [Spirometra erinaceieuropaei]